MRQIWPSHACFMLSRGRVITRSCYHEVVDVTTHMGRFRHVLLEISLTETVSEIAITEKDTSHPRHRAGIGRAIPLF